MAVAEVMNGAELWNNLSLPSGGIGRGAMALISGGGNGIDLLVLTAGSAGKPISGISIPLASKHANTAI
ncbi:hypothetical protein FBU59_004729 [Linderina macrospora]|uniref:Uncharacterized protein n=1 Tax=Linderina macrospora TaxID=4868 RepID=A0ACC1J4N7_9FUNG|nr:hypothetical protein FBU59_004729 [Linderina macrospora]